MTHFLISFPAEAMVLSEEEFLQAGIDANAASQEAMDAGVWVFGGGIDESVPTTLVAADGSVTTGTHPGSHLNGGMTVLDLPDRAAAEFWAAKFAAACRCAQEVRVLM
jgi:hypothetical protein